MAEFTRAIVSRMRQLISDRRHTKRVNVRLPFIISLVGPAVNSNGSKRISRLNGHTLDVSLTGIALVVPSIILGEHHLLGETRHLDVNLQLPSGPIELRVAPIRYESLDEHETETGYLIHAQIMEVAEGDRARLGEFISKTH